MNKYEAYSITDSCCYRIITITTIFMLTNFRAINKQNYLLKANEQAAAEKQPVIHVPMVDNAGNATQLRAAPIIKKDETRKTLRKKSRGFAWKMFKKGN